MELRSFAVAYMLYIATNVPVTYNKVSFTKKEEDCETMAVQRRTKLVPIVEGAASNLSLRGQ